MNLRQFIRSLRRRGRAGSAARREGFAERALRNIDSGSASLRLDVEGPDHVAPLLRFVGDELAKVGGRADKWCDAQISKTRLDLGIGKTHVDIFIELVDGLRRRVHSDTDELTGRRSH